MPGENGFREGELIGDEPLAEVRGLDVTFVKEIQNGGRDGCGIARPFAVQDFRRDHEMRALRRSQTSTTFSRELNAEMRK